MVEFNDRRPGGTFSDPKPYITKGGQGKFFQDPKPVDEHRYQKGYTPDRMREVNDMDLEVNPGKEGAFSGPAGAHRVKETIARSTTPADELHAQFNGDVLRINTGQKQRTTSGNYSYSRVGGYGHVNLDTGYRYSGSNDDVRKGEERAGHTLMHELGHVRSEVEATEHTHARTREHLGQEEAFADDNMMSRWRPDPRDVRAGRSSPPSSAYEHEEAFKSYQVPGVLHRMTGGKTAHKAYLKARETPLQKPLREKAIRAERTNAVHQPEMFRGYDTPGYDGPKGIPDYARPEGALHPLQFGKL